MKPLDYLARKWIAMSWLVIGRQRAALEVFDAMLARWPDDAYALASRAHIHGEAGRTAEALVDSEHLLRVAPDNARAWFNHGFMLESCERWDDAMSAFKRATELSPQLDRAWYGLGLVLIRLQRYDEAIAALKRNTELQPGWYQLARVHVDRHDPEAAVKIIRHLKGFEPKVAAQLERETGLLVEPRAS
jgi:tetratricopeptide (TPR) repeat protein